MAAKRAAERDEVARMTSPYEITNGTLHRAKRTPTDDEFPRDQKP